MPSCLSCFLLLWLFESPWSICFFSILMNRFYFSFIISCLYLLLIFSLTITKTLIFITNDPHILTNTYFLILFLLYPVILYLYHSHNDDASNNYVMKSGNSAFSLNSGSSNTTNYYYHNIFLSNNSLSNSFTYNFLFPFNNRYALIIYLSLLSFYAFILYQNKYIIEYIYYSIYQTRISTSILYGTSFEISLLTRNHFLFSIPLFAVPVLHPVFDLFVYQSSLLPVLASHMPVPGLEDSILLVLAVGGHQGYYSAAIHTFKSVQNTVSAFFPIQSLDPYGVFTSSWPPSSSMSSNCSASSLCPPCLLCSPTRSFSLSSLACPLLASSCPPIHPCTCASLPSVSSSFYWSSSPSLCPIRPIPTILSFCMVLPILITL